MLIKLSTPPAQACPVEEVSAEEDSVLSRAEEEVNAYTRMLKEKWGIEAATPVKVVCSCKCCGDVCPMGAMCCCPSEKFPIRIEGSLVLRGAGCSTVPRAPLAPPQFLSWQFLTTPDLNLEIRSNPTEERGREALLGAGRTLKPETPPPRTSWRFTS